jgi:NADH:ubiquinone oxidoreductase subunit D
MYSATESPNGELGWYVVSDGSSNPYRIRVRPPSFINYPIFGKLLTGAMIADLVAMLGSFNIIAGELDR